MKSNMKKHVFTAIYLLVSCFVFAEKGQSKINIQTMVTTGWEYNSNFWRTPDDEVTVDTYTLQPGVFVGYETAKSKIEADFTLMPFWYSDRDTPPPDVGNASEDDFVGFHGKLIADTQATDQLSIGLNDTIYRTRNPEKSDIFSDSVSRDLYTINRFTPYLYYDLGKKFGLGLKYRNVYTDYSDGDSEGSKENRGILNFYYNFNKLSSVFLSYNLWGRDYDLNTPNYLSNKLTLNYVRQVHYFSIDVGGGYHHRSFDEDRRDDLDLFAWHVIIKGQKPAAPAKNPRGHMRLALRQDYNDAGTDDQYYIATQLDAELGYVFMKKIHTTLKVYYQNSDYQNDPRNQDDDTYSISGLIEYQFWKHGKINFELGYKDRESNVAGNDYDDTFAAITLNFGYDFDSM